MANAQATTRNAIELLEEDHRKVKHIFKQFENAEQPARKKDLVTKAIEELTIHTQIEEELLYPQILKTGGEELHELGEEAYEEHHVVKLLMSELKNMEPDDERYDAKFTVLIENVEHHIDEEEEEMFPKIEKAGKIDLERLGHEMFERKMELRGQGDGISEMPEKVSSRANKHNGAPKKRAPRGAKSKSKARKRG